MLHTIVPLRGQDNSVGHNSQTHTIMTPHILYLSAAMLLTACTVDVKPLPPSAGTQGGGIPPWVTSNQPVGPIPHNNGGIYPNPYQPRPVYPPVYQTSY